MCWSGKSMCCGGNVMCWGGEWMCWRGKRMCWSGKCGVLERGECVFYQYCCINPRLKNNSLINIYMRIAGLTLTDPMITGNPQSGSGEGDKSISKTLAYPHIPRLDPINKNHTEPEQNQNRSRRSPTLATSGLRAYSYVL